MGNAILRHQRRSLHWRHDLEMPKIKYDKVGQHAADNDDNDWSQDAGGGVGTVQGRNPLAMKAFAFRLLCVAELLFSISMLFSSVFVMSTFAIEAVLGLILYRRLLASEPVACREGLSLYLYTKACIAVTASVLIVRMMDTVIWETGALVGMSGLLGVAAVTACIAGSLRDQFSAVPPSAPIAHELQTPSRVTVVADDDDDADWVAEQQRLADEQRRSSQALEAQLNRASDMSKEMELRATAQQQSADSAMDAYEPEVMEAVAESENELVAALQREGRHEEAARLQAMIAPMEATSAPETSNKSKSKKKKKKASTKDAAAAAPPPVIEAAAPVVAQPKNPLAAFEQEWIAAPFVQATDIEMAFALDAEDVESFMGSAEFSCVASGLIQGGVAKSYFSIKLADIPEFSCAGNEDKRVLVETLHNTNAMQIKITCKSGEQGAAEAAVALAESLFGM